MSLKVGGKDTGGSMVEFLHFLRESFEKLKLKSKSLKFVLTKLTHNLIYQKVKIVRIGHKLYS